MLLSFDGSYDSSICSQMSCKSRIVELLNKTMLLVLFFYSPLYFL